MIGPIIELGKTIISGVIETRKDKQRLKKANVESKIRLAESRQKANEDWERRSLENAGWKDDVLFYAVVAMYVYSAIDPEGAAQVFKNWDEVIPEWWMKITMWLVASIIGVKKLGPGLIAGVKKAVSR